MYVAWGRMHLLSVWLKPKPNRGTFRVSNQNGNMTLEIPLILCVFLNSSNSQTNPYKVKISQ